MNKLGVAVAALLILATAAVAVYAWNSMGDVTMSAAGYIALILGVLATLGLGAVLIGLLFYSHAKGFDDDVGGRFNDDENSRP